MNLDCFVQYEKKGNKQSVDRPTRLGIAGCGYVTRMSHLPAVQMMKDVRVTALADIQLGPVSALADQYDVPFLTTDYRDFYHRVDAVIIATPHHLHAQAAIDFLSRGIHVLVEKPMAVSVSECQQMITAAESSGAKLAVGLMRRFFDSSRLVKKIIASGFLGKVVRFEAQETVLFDRFNASPFTVLPPCGGVLLDTGPHCLDLLLWWLGDFDVFEYWDDARGGVEANCRIEITTVQGVPGIVELSRTRRLPNKIRIICERGRIDFPTIYPDLVTVTSTEFSGPISISKQLAEEEEPHQLPPYFVRQLENFTEAILDDRPLAIPGEEGMRSIAVIERCRQARRSMDLPVWEEINQAVSRRVNL